MFTISRERWFRALDETLPYKLRHEPDVQRILEFNREKHQGHRRWRNGYGVAAIVFGFLAFDNPLDLILASCCLLLCLGAQVNVHFGPPPTNVVEEYVAKNTPHGTVGTRE